VITYNEIRDLAEKDRIAFKKHAVLRMHQRKILADEVREVLLRSEVVENYPRDRPFPSYLVLGYTKRGRPLHAVVAVDVEEPILWVITLYEPNLEEWQEGFKKRRKSR